MGLLIFILFILAAVGVGVFLLLRRGAKRTAVVSGWSARYSQGVELKGDSKGLFSFDFPASPDHVNYILKPYSKPITKQIVFTCKVDKISGSPTLEHTGTGERRANVRIMVERSGDDMNSDYFRFWSNPASIDLMPDGKTYSITVPIDSKLWSSVYGHFGTVAPSEFLAAMNTPMAVGITFGGGYAFGHGVYVAGGAAKFTLLDFAVS